MMTTAPRIASVATMITSTGQLFHAARPVGWTATPLPVGRGGRIGCDATSLAGTAIGAEP